MTKMFFLILIQVFSFSSLSSTEEISIDPNGYLMFCPCMGRFGNQVDQMLGSFNFAKALNRTIVVPPFIDFKHLDIELVPFEEIFEIKHLAKFHKVISMDKFMSNIASTLWPKSNRSIFCYQERSPIFNSTNDGGCNAKDGNPFQYFWDNFKIDFVSSEFYKPLHYEIEDSQNIQKWKDNYPASQYPVLAFLGAPSVFPVSRAVRFLQKHLTWSDSINKQAKGFLKNLEKPILGVHLRQQTDWERVCKNLDPKVQRHLFASAQCLGENFELAPRLTDIMCQPNWNEITARIDKWINAEAIKTLYISTDNDVNSHLLMKHLNNSVNVVKYTPSNQYIDINVLSRVDFFIANCVSSYSAIATYDRLIHDLPVDFWGLYSEEKEEL